MIGINRKETNIKLAALQFRIKVDDHAYNIDKMEEFIEKAVSKKANILVVFL